MRSHRFGQVAAAPEPVSRNERSPIEIGGYEGPALPLPGTTSRQPTVDLAYTQAAPPAAEGVNAGQHGYIVAQPGYPVGVQLAWDGPRKMTYRLPPQPWAEGLIVDDYSAADNRPEMRGI